MKATIQPSTLKGMIDAPASKSSMQRACAAALLKKGKTIIANAGTSNDDKAAIEIIKALGASVLEKKGELFIESMGVNPVSSEINCKESGLSIRMFTPIVALSDKQITISGEGSLKKRPLSFFDEVLPKIGAKIKTNEGRLPMIVQGPILPADIEVDGSLSSQFLTGLLFAYSVASNNNVSITVNNLTSKPYIDLTLDVMKKFGLSLPVNHNYKKFSFIESGHQSANNPKDSTTHYTVETDWSNGAFLLVAGAIAGPIMVRGLDLTSTQADKAIIDALMFANAGIAIEAKGIKVHPKEMKGFVFDASNCPDLFPPLVALAAFCHGRTTIYGVSRLIHKESNRALSLQDEFDKMGLVIRLERDEMIIQGNGKIKGADVHSNHDHRIAMACAIAGLKADSEMVIDEAQAVEKSYPSFFADLQKLGADVSLDNKIKLHE